MSNELRSLLIMKKILSQTLIAVFMLSNLFNCQLAFGSNYVPVSTTTTESYSSSSPVGRFETHNGNYTPPVYVQTSPIATYDAYGNVVVAPYTAYAYPSQVMPVSNNNANPNNDSDNKNNNNDQNTYSTSASPVYAGNAYYNNAQNSYNSNVQDIETPQSYTKTTTNNVNYVDPREKADKVIDRGMKVLGTLAVGAAAAGLIIYGLKN